MTKAATVLLGLLLWFALLWAWYGLVATLIAFAVLAVVVLLAVGLGRAAKRGDAVAPDREEQPLDSDLPDTNGETR